MDDSRKLSEEKKSQNCSVPTNDRDDMAAVPREQFAVNIMTNLTLDLCDTISTVRRCQPERNL